MEQRLATERTRRGQNPKRLDSDWVGGPWARVIELFGDGNNLKCDGRAAKIGRGRGCLSLSALLCLARGESWRITTQVPVVVGWVAWNRYESPGAPQYIAGERKSNAKASTGLCKSHPYWRLGAGCRLLVHLGGVMQPLRDAQSGRSRQPRGFRLPVDGKLPGEQRRPLALAGFPSGGMDANQRGWSWCGKLCPFRAGSACSDGILSICQAQSIRKTVT